MSVLSLGSESYINLRTLRKSGEGVDTPVWVVADGEQLYVYTQTDSGKVKRARRNGSVQVAACNMRGTVKGAWKPAEAVVDDSRETMEKVIALLQKKYGWQFRLTMWSMGEKAYNGRSVVVIRA